MHTIRRLTNAALLGAFFAALASPALSAGAQKHRSSRDSLPQHRVPLLQKKDLTTLGWALLATAATMPFDKSIANAFADSSLQANGTYKSAVGHLTTIHERSL